MPRIRILSQWARMALPDGLSDLDIKQRLEEGTAAAREMSGYLTDAQLSQLSRATRVWIIRYRQELDVRKLVDSARSETAGHFET